MSNWPIVAVATLLLSGGLSSSRVATAQEETLLQVPSIDLGERQLAARSTAQRAAAADYRVFHDFTFDDRLADSRITFRHRATEDATSSYKMVHYDHGNGLAIADIDGDSRLDLLFTTQEGANQLWRNAGGGRFENVTDRAGVAMGEVISVAASFADIDNDGDADLFVTTVRMGNRLFENDGQGVFEDVTTRAGVGHVGHSSGAVFFDYDNDGKLDLFVTNVGKYTGERRGQSGYWIGYSDAFSGHLFPERTERSILYRNLGDGRFQDVTSTTGLVDEGWSGDAHAVDFNRDGFVDLYVTNMQGDDRYWQNRGGARFVDETASYFPKTPWGTMGVSLFDFQNDGRMDLLLTDMHSDMAFEFDPGAETQKSLMTWPDEHLQGGDNNIFGNAFYLGSESRPLEEASDRLGAENFWPWGTSVGDLNADGYPDVFIASSMNFPFRYGINSVLLNESGRRFVPSEFLLGVEPRREGRVRQPWFELTCPQQKPADAAPLGAIDAMYEACQFRTGRVTVQGTLGSRTAAIFDLDGDGDLDIVTGEFHSEPQVLVSNLTERTDVRYVEVELQGTRSNRDGLGALVRVVSGGQTYHRYHDGKSGYLSQSSYPLYFGLGRAATVDRIEVDWPSGQRQVVSSGLGINERITIRESADP